MAEPWYNGMAEHRAGMMAQQGMNMIPQPQHGNPSVFPPRQVACVMPQQGSYAITEPGVDFLAQTGPAGMAQSGTSGIIDPGRSVMAQSRTCLLAEPGTSMIANTGNSVVAEPGSGLVDSGIAKSGNGVVSEPCLKMKEQDNSTEKGKKPCTCDICFKTFANRSDLRKHKRLHTGPHTCEICGKVFVDKSSMTRHVNTHGSKTFPCGECDKYFIDIASVNKHRAVHIDTKAYKCELCVDRRFKQKSSLQTHMNSHTNIREHICVICEKDFLDKPGLQYHMRSHSTEKPFPCDICGQEFMFKSRLRIHSRIHTGERFYHCDVCYKSFGQNSHLKTHMRIHTGERPYKCDYCPKDFQQKRDLHVHHDVHKGKKRPTCDVCFKSYAKQIQVTMHMRRKHPYEEARLRANSDKVFNRQMCDICLRSFTTEFQLALHRRKKHPDADTSLDEKEGLADGMEKKASKKTVEALNALIRSHMIGKTRTNDMYLRQKKNRKYRKPGKSVDRKPDVSMLKSVDRKPDVSMLKSVDRKPDATKLKSEPNDAIDNANNTCPDVSVVKKEKAGMNGKRGPGRPSLKEVMRSRLTELRHQCDVCGSSFKHKSILARHMRKHTWESTPQIE